jgi:hypothetical protein
MLSLGFPSFCDRCGPAGYPLGCQSRLKMHVSTRDVKAIVAAAIGWKLDWTGEGSMWRVSCGGCHAEGAKWRVRVLEGVEGVGAGGWDGRRGEGGW